jgi:hypothetical protein
MTTLYTASYNGDETVVHLQLNAGADIDAQNEVQ